MRTAVLLSFVVVAALGQLNQEVFKVPTLKVDAMDGKPAGSTVVLQVTLKDAADLKISMMGWTLVAPPNSTIGVVSAGQAALTATKAVMCAPADSASRKKCLLGNSNKTLIGDGVVAILTVNLSEDFKGGNVRIEDLSASTADGAEVYVEAK